MKKAFAFVWQARHKKALPKGWLFALLILLFIPHWIISWRLLESTIAPDLLLRTIGSRLQEAGQPIYEYKWQRGDPIKWLNPYPDTRTGVNGVVSTPFFLWLMQPLARFDYCSIRVIWGCVEEMFLFATTWLCCLIFQQLFRQLIFIVIAFPFFIYSRNWLLHLYNGQVYVFYAFAFALTGYLTARRKAGKSLLILFPLISIVRPFFLLAVVPFLKLSRSYIIACLAAVAVAALLALSTSSVTQWKQYNDAMKIYSKERTGELSNDTISPGSYLPFVDPCTRSPEKTFKVFGAGCLFSLQHYLVLLGIRISNVQIFQIILVITLLFISAVGFRRRWFDNTECQLLLSFLFYQVCELITPASRNPYNMIQWLPAIAWLVRWGNGGVMWILLVGLCLNHDIPFRFTYQREIGEILLFTGLVVFLMKRKEKLYYRR